MQCRVRTRIYRATDSSLNFLLHDTLSGKVAFVEFADQEEADEWLREIEDDNRKAVA